MILRGFIALCLLLLETSRGQATPGPQSADSVALVRRIAATVQLAVQEYGLGVRDGKVVAPAEVDEARLFLSEAGKTAGRLRSGSIEMQAGIDWLVIQGLLTRDPTQSGGFLTLTRKGREEVRGRA